MATATLTDHGSVVLTGELIDKARIIVVEALCDARGGWDGIIRHADRTSGKRKGAVYTLAGLLRPLNLGHPSTTLKAEQANLLGDLAREYREEAAGMLEDEREEMGRHPKHRAEHEASIAEKEVQLERYEAVLAALGRSA